MQPFLKVLKANCSIQINRSYLFFIIVCLIVPVALNLSTTIYFEMIIPISGAFIFSNMMFIEKQLGLNKQYYMTNYNKGYIFLVRTIINFSFYVVISLGFYIYLSLLKLNTTLDMFAHDNLDFLTLIFVVGGINFLFFGLLASLIGLLTQMPLAGLLTSLIYGLLWMSQYTNFDYWIINPYPYSAGNGDVYIYKLFYFLLTVLLLLFCYKYSKHKTIVEN